MAPLPDGDQLGNHGGILGDRLGVLFSACNEPHSVRCRVEVPRESQCLKVGPRRPQDSASGFDFYPWKVTDGVAHLCHDSLNYRDSSHLYHCRSAEWRCRRGVRRRTWIHSCLAHSLAPGGPVHGHHFRCHGGRDDGDMPHTLYRGAYLSVASQLSCVNLAWEEIWMNLATP